MEEQSLNPWITRDVPVSQISYERPLAEEPVLYAIALSTSLSGTWEALWSLLFRILLLVTESPGPAGIINIMIGLIGLGEFVHVYCKKERGPVAEPCGQYLKQRFLIFTLYLNHLMSFLKIWYPGSTLQGLWFKLVFVYPKISMFQKLPGWLSHSFRITDDEESTKENNNQWDRRETIWCLQGEETAGSKADEK